MSIALLDADIIAYRAAVANQEIWPDETVVTNRSKAFLDAERTVHDWRQKSRCTGVLLCFSPRGEDRRHFRKDIASYYKEARGEKPVLYWDVVDHLESLFRFYRLPYVEADDVMGILGTSEKMRDAVIVSIDKDMLTIPGKVLNPDKMARPRMVTKLEAVRNWFTQALTGDSSDGYKGCPGVGEVGAGKMLANVTDEAQAWGVVLNAFANKSLSMEEALANVRMARILRREDYDKDKEMIRLWHPIPELAPWIPARRPEPEPKPEQPTKSSSHKAESSPSTRPAQGTGKRKRRGTSPKPASSPSSSLSP